MYTSDRAPGGRPDFRAAPVEKKQPSCSLCGELIKDNEPATEDPMGDDVHVKCADEVENEPRAELAVRTADEAQTAGYACPKCGEREWTRSIRDRGQYAVCGSCTRLCEGARLLVFRWDVPNLPYLSSHRFLLYSEAIGEEGGTA